MSGLQQLLMPKLGLTMTEGSVVEWPVAEGGDFAAGDVYVVVESDKVANEIEAPADGRLTRILVPAGETVAVGTVIAEWEAEGKVAKPDHGAAATAGPVAPAAQPIRVDPGPIALAAARKLTQAKQQIPHFYLGTEIEAGALRTFRVNWNADHARPRLTVTQLFVAAIGRTLAAHRELNRIWDEDNYIELPSVDVGIAVHTGQGLLVPVLRGADKLSLEQLAARAAELVSRARQGTLAPGDVGGGAITLSNAGMYDVTYMGSIINPGQAAILGVGSERRTFRPDDHGLPRLVSEIGVVLSCDHRVLDGVAGLRLLNGIRTRLESPQQLLD